MKIIKGLIVVFVIVAVGSYVAHAAVYTLDRRDNPANTPDGKSWYVIDLYQGSTYVSTWAAVSDDPTGDWTDQNHGEAESFVSSLTSMNWDNRSWNFATAGETFSTLWDTFDDDPDYFFGLGGNDPAFDYTYSDATPYYEIWGWNSDVTQAPDPEGYYALTFEWYPTSSVRDSADNPTSASYSDPDLSIWVYSNSGGGSVPELPSGATGAMILLFGGVFGWIKRFKK
jgi:hypothetical protein